jgi:hypothetical protein
MCLPCFRNLTLHLIATLYHQTLSQKQVFTEHDFNSYWCLADTFFCQWQVLVGYDGIIKYIHMVGAGYVCYFYKVAFFDELSKPRM